jgi:dissimilatory sulfite reductase (desulfoviridin) alpha/beta subunit
VKWSKEADTAIRKVPFFIRKKVIQKVEDHVEQKGKTWVEISDVEELKKKFLSKGGMEKEIKGYEITSCFGGSGCPNSANSVSRLAADMENIFETENLLGFLKSTVKGDLKFHHEFRVSLSECPNACSRPQIADIGIIGAVLPEVSEEACTLCGSCADACDELAIEPDGKNQRPIIHDSLCLKCAKCIRSCPTGALIEKQKGYRVMLGGRLGRRPRLAMEVPGIHSHDQVLEILKNCLKFYKKTSKTGERFSHILPSIDPFI